MRSVVLATPVGGIPDLIKWGGQRCPPFFLSPLPLQPQMVTGGMNPLPPWGLASLSLVPSEFLSLLFLLHIGY